MNNAICILPWINALVDEEGQFRVCCYSNRDNGSFISNVSIDDIKHVDDIKNHEHMKEIRRRMMNGEKLSMCDYCYKVEEKSISHRQLMNNKYEAEMAEYIPLTQNDGTIDNPYKTIEIRMGNHCNLKCKMCSPQWSSSLAKEFKDIHGREFNFKSNGNLKWYENEASIEMVKQFLPTCKNIYFGGSGEPFLNNQIPHILEWLVENGYAQNQILIYSSNATLIPHKHIKYWKHFESISLTCSVDSFGKTYEYIRYPSTWNNVLSNLRYFDELANEINFSRLELNATLQILNLFNFDEFVEWLYFDSGFNNINRVPRVKPLMFPKYLDTRYLPEHVKKLCYEKIRNVAHKITIPNNILPQVRYIFTEQQDLTIMDRFFEEMTIVDNHRKIDIKDFINISLLD